MAEAAQKTADEKLAEALARIDSKDYKEAPERSPIGSFPELDEAERRREELWAESVRRYNLKVSADRRLAWAEHHRQQAVRLRRTLEDLIAHHQAQAAQLEDDS